MLVSVPCIWIYTGPGSSAGSAATKSAATPKTPTAAAASSALLLQRSKCIRADRPYFRIDGTRGRVQYRLVSFGVLASVDTLVLGVQLRRLHRRRPLGAQIGKLGGSGVVETKILNDGSDVAATASAPAKAAAGSAAATGETGPEAALRRRAGGRHLRLKFAQILLQGFHLSVQIVPSIAAHPQGKDQKDEGNGAERARLRAGRGGFGGFDGNGAVGGHDFW